MSAPKFYHRLTIRRKADGRKLASAVFRCKDSKQRAEDAANAFLAGNPELLCQICPVEVKDGGAQ